MGTELAEEWNIIRDAGEEGRREQAPPCLLVGGAGEQGSKSAPDRRTLTFFYQWLTGLESLY